MVSPIKGTIERGESEFEDAKLKNNYLQVRRIMLKI